MGNGVMGTGPASGSKQIDWTPFVLFACAVVVYLPAMWWGLPYATSPERVPAWGNDELGPLGSLAELYSVFLAAEPKIFNPQYPLLHYMIQALFTGPYLVWLKLTGGITTPTTSYPFGLEDPIGALRTLTILSRLPSLLMGAGVVVVAYRTARIWWDEGSARFAAISAMLAYPMFYFARTSNVDMGALLWTALGLAVFSSALRYGLTDRRALWLGVLAGLATATKDASYAPFAAMGAVLVVRHWRGRPGLAGRRFGWLRAPTIALIIGGLTYALASGLVFSLQRWLSHVGFVLHGSGVEGSYYFSIPPTLAGYLRMLAETAGYVVQSLGWPLAIAGVAGVVLAARRDRTVLLLLLPILGIVVGVLAPVRFVRFRFVMFIAYTLALFAGFCLAILWSRRRQWGSMLARVTALAAVVVCVGWAAARGVDLTVQMARDSRYAAGEWLKRNAESGDVIGFYGAARKLPAIEAEISTVQMPSELRRLGTADTDNSSVAPPEFILVIPQQKEEVVHEWTVSPDDFLSLMEGSHGYRLVFAVRGPSFTGERTVSFVNPPTRVFVRDDVLPRLNDRSPRIELSWP